MNDFNAELWNLISKLGWVYWGPCVVIALENIIILTILPTPGTTLGRAARTMAWLAHLPMLFSPWFNVLGSVALPLLLIASNVLYVHLFIVSRNGDRQPLQMPWTHKALRAMIAPPPDGRQRG